MRSQYPLSTLGTILAFLAGILLQRFYPIGEILSQLGLRDLLPIPPNVPENDPDYVPPNWDVPAEDRGQLMLFVLMGQSNMSGRGRLDSPVTPAPHPHIYTFNKDYRWYPAREPLGTVSNEVDWIATDGGTGVGPGLAFAHALLEQDPTLKIGLIPCARGASSIQEWQRDLSQNSLYGACLKRIRAATTYGTIAAVLFAQGESDADNPDLYADRILSAQDWDTKFIALAEALRADLDSPGLPVLFTQLGHYTGDTDLPYWDTVKSRQSSVTLPWVAMIETDDLPLQTDTHFSTESNVEIGRRFADAYLSLVAHYIDEMERK